MKRALTAFTVALVVASGPTLASSPSATVGLIPAESPAVTEAIADGARLAFEQAAAVDGLDIELIVADGATHWSTASAPAVRLAFESAMVALITPPDRATAHLVAQIGSRAHIPVLTTTRAPSIGGTGSYWVIPLVELTADADETIVEPPRSLQLPQASLLCFESAFRNRFGREPDGWARIGYKAASAISRAVRDNNLDRYRIAQDLRASSVIGGIGARAASPAR